MAWRSHPPLALTGIPQLEPLTALQAVAVTPADAPSARPVLHFYDVRVANGREDVSLD